MGFFRRIAGIFGGSRDDADHPEAAAAATGGGGYGGGDVPHEKVAAGHATRRGFSVQVPVPVERPAPGPVLVPCHPGEGGVQGFWWYTRRLRIDEDGDVADEFLDEVPQESLASSDAAPVERFKVKYNTRPITLAMRKQTVAVDGDIRHCLEHQGQLRWV